MKAAWINQHKKGGDHEMKNNMPLLSCNQVHRAFVRAVLGVTLFVLALGYVLGQERTNQRRTRSTTLGSVMNVVA